jgi:hypothetical protein
MARDMLVMIHAGSGIAALVTGLLVFLPPDTPSRRLRWRAGYGALLVTLTISLVLLIAVDWADLAGGARIAFTGLAILAGIMLTRLYLAHRLTTKPAITGWRRRYVSHVYFTYISLWVGVGIVPALRTDTPALWVPVAIVAVLGTGNVIVGRYVHRIEARTAT